MLNRIRGLLVTAAVFALVCAGCACGGPGGTAGDDDDDIEGCSDFDGDGYGVGADCLGPDLCDSIPKAWTREQCDQICDDYDGRAPGCECDAVEPEICYLGPPETLGLGSCRAGIMVCVDGNWGSCDGQVLPGEEVCDGEGVDEDCDGEVDEGVTSACGDCNFECEEDCVGVGCDDGFDPEQDGATGVVLTPEGGITLDGETGIRNYVIWIANSNQGSVTKINTRTREEEGRYYTSDAAGGGGFGGPNPSRTTVNHHGDVVVANRGGAGEATRFNASDCPDANGNGRVDTSTGIDDIYEYGDDECMIWATPVAVGLRGSGFELRIGLDGVVEEYVWSGSTNTGIVYEIEAGDGELTGNQIPGTYPYGLAMGPDNALWTFNGWGGAGAPGLIHVDTTDPDLEKTLYPYPAGEHQYGITVDNVGRPWIGGSVARYDPDLDEWESPAAEVSGGGIACDGEGNAWVGRKSGGFGGGPWKIDAETMEHEVLGGGGGWGWAVDFDGFIWSVPFVGTEAFAIDPDTLEVDWRYDRLVGAYTYSDMTGFQLINATNPIGIYPVIFEACGGDAGVTNWVELDWDAVVPAGTTVGFAFKTADDLAALTAASLNELGTVPPLDGPVSLGDAIDGAGLAHGSLMYIQITLSSILREDAPIVNALRVSHSCDDILR